MLKSENDFGKALQQWFFSDSIFYKTKPFMQNGIQIVKSFKCQKFGQISAKRQSVNKCGHCNENHLFGDFPNKNQESECANCNLKHPANYTQCYVYINHLQTVMKSRGLDQSIPHND